MSTTSNTLSVFSSEIKNKGFALLNETFTQYGWHLIKNEMNWISYTKLSDETSFFDIKILQDKIVVSVPIKNSRYQYVTSFKRYYDASEYTEQKLIDYCG
jgi:hypothetical protein